MFDNTLYVVKFKNGKYYAGGFSSESETDELRKASKYTLDWQPMKDMYLSIYLNKHPMKYDLIKVKQYFEIVK